MSSIREVLEQQATERTDNALIISPETGRQLSYDALRNLAESLSAYFDKHGAGHGDHVAMLLPNGLSASALFLAIMATGRVVAPLSLVAQPSQLQYVLDHCDPALIFTTKDRLPGVQQMLGETRAARAVAIDADRIDTGPWSGLGSEAESAECTQIAESALTTAQSQGVEGTHVACREPTSPIDPNQHALLMYTSGTTGVPKGVPLSHRNLLGAAHAVANWHGLQASDRVLSALPLYHINGQVIATLTPFVSGGSIVAPTRFSASQWWAAAERYTCTWINMVPTIVAYLLNSEQSAPRALPSIRFGRSASAPLPPDQQRRFEARFGFPIIEAMGMTESSSVVFCNPMSVEKRKIGSPGKPIGVDVKIVDPDGNTVATGESGEIWLRGDPVMQGYYKSPEQTQAALTGDGWLRSGDLGRFDEDGFVFITGRLKELIIKGGENIAPREIDEALLRHPAILEAAAVGVPHEAYGQDILAAVVLKDDQAINEAELRAFCEQELGRYKTPATFRFVDELPKGASGKVQRLKLLEPR